MKKIFLLVFCIAGLCFAYNHTKFIMEQEAIRHGVEIIQETNSRISADDAGLISYTLYKSCKKRQIPFPFALGIMKTESRFNPNVKSGAGAIGLMQILPSTARVMSKIYDIPYTNLYDIETNIELGTAYLFHLKKDLVEYEYVAAGYNGGKGGAIRYIKYRQGILPRHRVHRQTREYVPRVMEYFREFHEKMYIRR